MMQDNLYQRNVGRNVVLDSKVIRIDQEVWTELQRRAVPFQDKPNSVLRKILGLRPAQGCGPTARAPNGLGPRIAKLLYLVAERVDEPPVFSPTRTGQSYRFRSQRGKVVAFIIPQNLRLKVESCERMATEVGVDTWDHLLRNGWWRQDHSVYWHIPNDDEDAYARVAGVLSRLWQQ